MGDVYRATRLLIGDSVAIKVLHSHLAADPQAAERFRREAVTATQLRHRNVVALYDVGVAHGVPYILMELAEGFSLRQIINEYRVLPLDFVVTVAAQVAAALEEAHRLGIVHRDIKPENIIANETAKGWQIKVLDFGIAKLYNQTDIGLTQDGSAMGTPQYMSPEQCLGESLDGRSDIYSLGIVLYEMLCGTVPFKGPSASAVAIYQVQNDPPPPRSLNPDIHPDVEAVLLRALAKSPDDRPRSPQMLSQQLIGAATAAFRSGFTAVSAEPIAPPDVAPQFDADGTAIPSGETGTPSLSVEAAPGNDVPNSPAATPVDVEQVIAIPTPDVTPAVPIRLETPRTDAEQETIAVTATNVAAKPEVPTENQPITPRVDELQGFDRNEVDLPDESAPQPAEPQSEYEIAANAPSEPEERLPEYQLDEAGPSRRRRLAVILGALLFVGAIFILGVAAGVWFFVLRETRPPVNTVSRSTSPSTSNAPTNTPPAGMAYVPGGEFMMGSDSGDEYSRPAHVVSVKPFFIDITEVTNEDYKKFIDATGHKPPPDWKAGTYRDGRAKFPVTGVRWNDADAFAKWAGKRLPTEAEWEFAARGTDGRIYPWGNEWQDGLANAGGRSKGFREAGQGGPSPFGLYDMAGNAWEWTASDAVEYPRGKAFAQQDKGKKILRGGSYIEDIETVRADYRGFYHPVRERDYGRTGFRCAKDAPNN